MKLKSKDRQLDRTIKGVLNENRENGRSGAKKRKKENCLKRRLETIPVLRRMARRERVGLEKGAGDKERDKPHYCG
jgi:hypothetical protein